MSHVYYTSEGMTKEIPTDHIVVNVADRSRSTHMRIGRGAYRAFKDLPFQHPDLPCVVVPGGYRIVDQDGAVEWQRMYLVGNNGNGFGKVVQYDFAPNGSDSPYVRTGMHPDTNAPEFVIEGVVFSMNKHLVAAMMAGLVFDHPVAFKVLEENAPWVREGVLQEQKQYQDVRELNTVKVSAAALVAGADKNARTALAH